MPNMKEKEMLESFISAFPEFEGEDREYSLRKAQIFSFLGKKVELEIDRPIGYVHHKPTYSITYPINYGYIPGILGGDGEELDVYLLGVKEPIEKTSAVIIASVQRKNDIEDKLVAAPEGMEFSDEEIVAAVSFQEKYYDSVISKAFVPVKR